LSRPGAPKTRCWRAPSSPPGRRKRRTESAVEKQRLALLEPRGFVAAGERVEIGGRGRRVVDPLAQQLGPVDHVDRQTLFVFVGEVAPQLVVGPQAAQRLEGERHEPPGSKGGVAVGRALDMKLASSARL